jgi:hypothetical protein
MVENPQDKGEQAERLRDLRGQVAGLETQDVGQVVFQEISPGRQPVTIYSVENGEPVSVPAYMLNAVMEKRLDDGRFRFVGKKEDAPEYMPGTVKCFLHPESPERKILTEIGMDTITCPAANLANQHSKRIHAQHRHKQEWAAYHEYKGEQEKKRYEERQDKQLEATLSIARTAGGQTGPSEAPSKTN